MILVVNSGSSSIKFRLFAVDQKDFAVVAEGLAERIGVDGRFHLTYQDQKVSFDHPLPNHEKAVQLIDEQLLTLKIVQNQKEIQAIGFRVVHGGLKMHAPVIIDSQIQQVIREASKLAPLHNPGALIAIKAFEKIFPASRLVACFDTAFHQTIPINNYLYPLPYEWYEKHQVRKFGFHGISYQYLTQKMSMVLNKPITKLNLIICHLGNGASICLVKNGQSYDTSMGLTPLAGLMMGTRCGDLDPSILAYMAKELNQDVFTITEALNNHSGLLGMSQLSSDIRDLVAGVHQNQKLPSLAFEKYVQTIAKFIVQYANELTNGEVLNGIIFTAGIGENSAEVRKGVIERLPLLNLSLDSKKNQTEYEDFQLISTPNSATPVYMVRTNEELLICQQVQALLQK